MAGYTPVFDSVYAGSLCGKWPTTAVWVTLLPLCDKHGHIDLSYQAICALTGWPPELLQQGIAELMQPDPDSRSSSEDGRRLVLLDPERRPWGWRVVNHGLYREKARKLQYDNERTASGRDAARKRESREVPASPAKSREVPLSDADADADADAEKNPSREETPSKGNARKRATSASTEFPLDFALDDALRAQALQRAPDCDADVSFAQFRAHHEARGSRFKNWRQAWVTWIGNYEHFGYPKRRTTSEGMTFAGKPVEWQ